jgi:hypothetical protein
MKVTREPTATVMSRGEALLFVMVMVVVFVDPPPPLPPLPPLPPDEGPVELPPHAVTRHAAASAVTANENVLVIIEPLRRTFSRC